MIRQLTILLLLSLSCAGCLFGSNTNTSYEGKHVDQSTLDKVSPGVKKDYVESLFGKPSSTETLSEGSEVWKWSYTRTKTSKGYVFLLFATSDKTKEEHSVCVQFVDGIVTKSWRN